MALESLCCHPVICVASVCVRVSTMFKFSMVCIVFKKEINYSEPCSNAQDKAQLSSGCTHLSTSERSERVFKWVQPKLNCALSVAFEHGSE